MKAAAYNLFKKTVENVRPPLAHSQFKEKGVLTPEEFVLAGDYLVQTCPTWSWEGGDASKRWSFLPADKQYLITRNVPCLQRASAVLSYAEYVDPKATGEDVEGGDWVATSSAADVDEELDAFEELPVAPLPDKGIPDVDDVDKDDEEESVDQEGEIPDISNLDLEAEEDDAVAPSHPTAAAPAATLPSPSRSGVLQTRTYDLLISYDNYYHVPRVWLIGYGEDRTPLTQGEVMEDVISDYFTHRDRKTVTVEDHPHRSAGGRVVSIHPCRHAEVMKKLATVIGQGNGGEEEEEEEEGQVVTAGGAESANEFKVEHYMVLFLKFISSVVPTIEYDYTMPAGL